MLNSKQLVRISLDTQQLLEKRLSLDVPLTNARIRSQSQPINPNWCFNYAYHTSIGTMFVFKERSKVVKCSTMSDSAPDGVGLWGLRLQIRIRCGSWRKCISYLLLKERHCRTGSFRCIWTHPVVLPPYSQIFQHTRTGDLRTIQSMFDLHKATPLDTTPDGVSLLHVSTADLTLI